MYGISSSMGVKEATQVFNISKYDDFGLGLVFLLHGLMGNK